MMPEEGRLETGRNLLAMKSEIVLRLGRVNYYSTDGTHVNGATHGTSASVVVRSV